MPPFNSRNREKSKSIPLWVWALIAVFLAISVGAYLILPTPPPDVTSKPPPLASSRLLYGYHAPIGMPIDVPIEIPKASLNSLSVNQIIAERASRVLPFIGSILPFGEYQSRQELFNEFSGHLRWESMLSRLFTGNGTLCGSGVSVDSFALLNPLLLVELRAWGLTRWNQKFNWSPSAPTPEPGIFNSDFPAWMYPTHLSFNLADREIEIEYQCGLHLAALKQWTKDPMSTEDIIFSLNTFNARDFGLEVMSVDASKTVGIEGNFGPRVLSDRITSKKRIGANEACSLISSELDPALMFRVTKLPASISLLLSSTLEDNNTNSALRVTISCL